MVYKGHSISHSLCIAPIARKGSDCTKSRCFAPAMHGVHGALAKLFGNDPKATFWANRWVRLRKTQKQRNLSISKPKETYDTNRNTWVSFKVKPPKMDFGLPRFPFKTKEDFAMARPRRPVERVRAQPTHSRGSEARAQSPHQSSSLGSGWRHIFLRWVANEKEPGSCWLVD